MPTPEQLVDALIEIAGRSAVLRFGSSEPRMVSARALVSSELEAARAALLAAMGGDAVPVAWRFEFRTHPGASWGRLYSTNHPGEECNVVRNIEPLYDRPPTPSAIAEGMRERCAKVAEDQAQVFLSPEYASPQPYGSMQERFACKLIAERIRALPPAPGEG